MSITREGAFLITCLVLLGAGWGMTQPLGKVAVTAGFQPFGLIFWQMALSGLLLGLITAARGKGLPLHRGALIRYLFIALAGTVLPNSASYLALGHLPAGINAILLSLVPMFALPVALALGLERFEWVRFAGLFAGLTGILLIVAPDASLPNTAALIWIPVALIAPLFYAMEGNTLAKIGLAGLDPIQALFGASLIGVVIAAPLAVGSGQFINPVRDYGVPEGAVIASAFIHGLVYATYVWLVQRAGPIFAAQCSYLVTGFGVVWAMLILGERYAPTVWLALAAMFVGLFLVQPRPTGGLNPALKPLP